jgi:hypothetical protein
MICLFFTCKFHAVERSDFFWAFFWNQLMLNLLILDKEKLSGDR